MLRLIIFFFFQAQESYVSYSPPHGPGGLASTVLRLHFRLSEPHFSKGELRLKCVSKQLREFTAASEYRVPISDKRQSSGLQVSLSRSKVTGDFYRKFPKLRFPRPKIKTGRGITLDLRSRKERNPEDTSVDGRSYVSSSKLSQSFDM